MKYLLEIEESEMDAFVGIFVDGIRMTEASRSAVEERVIQKVVNLGTKYEDSKLVNA